MFRELSIATNKNNERNYMASIIKPLTTNNFLKIPKEIIHSSSIGEKRISCYLYFLLNQTYDDSVMYTCNYLVRWCGYTPSRTKRKNGLSVNESFSNIIYWLYENLYISDFDDKKFSGDTFQYCYVDKNRFVDCDHFGMIYDFEFEMLRQYKSKTGSLLLLVLSYIRLHIWRNTDCNQNKRPETLNKCLTEISEDIGISTRMISKTIKELCDIGILKTATTPRFRDQDGVWHTEDMIIANTYKYHWDDTTKTYLLDQNYDCDKELKFGVQYLQQRKHGG